MSANIDEEHKNTSQNTLLFYIALAVLLFLSEELGRLLGMSGLALKISPIWPATGIALAALLLIGWRTWPSILLGFMAYNCLHLGISYSDTSQGILIGIALSVASLIQALLGAYLIKRFGNVIFYNSLRDTLIFLGSVLLTCCIAPTLNIAILYTYGEIQDNISLSWINFWVGDTIGVLLLTPLIIAFTRESPLKYNQNKFIEAVFLFTLLSVASLEIFFGSTPLSYWLLPFLLWAIFRFNIRGLTSALLLISFIAILANKLGYGPYYNMDVNQSLFFLVTFIGIITATMLILTGILNENNEAAKILKEYNCNLESTVNTRTHELQLAKDEIAIQEKLTSLAVLTAGISHEIKNPLTHIHELTVTAQDCTTNIKEAYEPHQNLIPADISDFVLTNYNNLKECLVKIEDYNKQAQEVVNIILHRSRRETDHVTGFKTVNIHNLLNGCCNKAIREFEKKTPYMLHVNKHYDNTIKPIEIITLDLSRVFTNIIDNAVYALRLKCSLHAESFEPTLTVQTSNRENDIEICIEDNGVGMNEEVLKRLFQPFFSTKPLGEGTGLGLALAHDIIVQDHRGTISVTSEKDKFTKCVITLPKTHLKDDWQGEC